MTKEKFDISVGSSIFNIFKDFKYPLYRCFGEYIDNSLQSFLDHKEKLNELGILKCIVNIEINNEKIVIIDNCFGMNKEEFQRAIKLSSINSNKYKENQLSIYGIGLKYASVYLGDCYEIISSCLNEDKKRSIKIDLKYLESSNPNEIDGDVDFEASGSHYTKIIIKDLRHEISGTTISKISNILGYVYEDFINNEQLVIMLNNQKVNYIKPEYLYDESGVRYCSSFNGSFKNSNGKVFDYTGSIGILKEGNQSIAGLKIIQAGRCVQPFYKPKDLFGSGNAFAQQRIIGKVVFRSNLEIVTADKQNLKLSQDDEEAFVKSLKEIQVIKDYLKIAQNYRKTKDNNKLNKSVINIVSDLSFSDNNKIISFNEKQDLLEKSRVNYVKSSENNNYININEKYKDYVEDYVITKDNEKIRFFYLVSDEENPSYFLNLKSEGEKVFSLIAYKNKIPSHFKKPEDIISFAILMVKSMIMSQYYGVKISDSKQIIEQINEYFRYSI